MNFKELHTELKDSPEVGFKLESLNGFTRSGLEVISQDTPQDDLAGMPTFNAVRSIDADRLPDEATKRDLSVPIPITIGTIGNNVEKKENNIRKKIKNNVRPGQFNAVRSIDADRLPDEAAAAGFLVPIPITIGTIGINFEQKKSKK